MKFLNHASAFFILLVSVCNLNVNAELHKAENGIDDPPTASPTKNIAHEKQKKALEELYKSTGGEMWVANSNWIEDYDFCTWYGVEKCSGNGNSVKELILDDNSLSGEIPKSLTKLKHLELLSFLYNQLTGKIPTNIGKLKKLKGLQLYNNNLTGGIPTSLRKLKQLKGLNLGINQLQGKIPHQLGKLRKLKYLDLSRNTLTGSIPSQLGKMKSMSYLYLNDNTLTGTIPTQLGLLKKLFNLDLYRNPSLEGPVPNELCRKGLTISLDEKNQCPEDCTSNCMYI